MIPDKIYVREYPDGIAHFWEIKRKDDVVATIPHEYIRKDALMEWAKEMENCSQLSAPLLAHELIRKLNSM